VHEFDNLEKFIPSITLAMNRAMNVVSDNIERVESNNIAHTIRGFDLLYV
jgi:hypothetical protein